MIQPVFVRGLWDRHKTFLIIVGVLMVLVNTFFMSFSVGGSGEIGPIETTK